MNDYGKKVCYGASVLALPFLHFHTLCCTVTLCPLPGAHPFIYLSNWPKTRADLTTVPNPSINFNPYGLLSLRNCFK